MAVKDLSSFVGQSAIVGQLAERIRITYQSGDPLPHLLLCGPPEMGKVTLARSVPGQMGVAVQHISASNIQKKLDLIGVLSNVNSNEIVIVEEPADLRAEILCMLTGAISDQKMDIEVGSRSVTMDLEPCTFIVTTSKPWQFPESFRRWFVALDFEPYRREEIAQILSQIAADDGLLIDNRGRSRYSGAMSRNAW